MKSKLTIAFLAAAVVVATVGVAPMAAGTAAANHGAGATNFTITLSDHTPGSQDVTMSTYAAGSKFDKPMKPWGNLTVIFPSGMGIQDCSVTQARAAGIDRHNDNSGTQTDKTFVGKYSERKRGLNHEPKYSSYNFYEEGSFAGESIDLYPDDQIVSRLADCYDNPSEAGWYRWNGYINGTTSGGGFIETNSYSHWYYICDCESYDQAVSKLGAPPETGGKKSSDGQPGTVVNRDYKLYASGGSGGGGGGGGGGSTATATSTSGGGGGGSTATATSASTATSGGGGQSTAASTAGGGTAGTSPTAGGAGATSPTSTGPGAGTSTGGATGTAAGTAAGTSTGGATGTAAVTSSPTSTHQPGFGVVAALLSLLAAALVAVRRR